MDTQAQPNSELEFGVIKKTNNYNKFRYMGGNRKVDIKHVKELQTQMERNREMFASMPILVNEDFFIVDGQHRYEAAKGIGLPVYYIVQQRASLNDARQLNIAQKRWGLVDFARSYADSGRKDYIELLRIKDRFPRISLSIVVEYLSSRMSGGARDVSFRQGEFVIYDAEDAISCLEVLDRVIHITGKPQQAAFARALWRALHHEDFDEQVFLKKLAEAPENLFPSTSAATSLRSIEDIFNRHKSIPVRLY